MKQRVFALLEIVTIGFPFCVFKVLLGATLYESLDWPIVGAFLFALGVADSGINVVNFVWLLLRRPDRPLSICVLHSLVGRFWPRAADLGTALDVMISFSLVAAMVGWNLFHYLPATGLRVWTACVVLNVLGAGVARLAQSIDALGKPPDAMGDGRTSNG